MRKCDVAVIGLVITLVLFAGVAVVVGSDYDRPAASPTMLLGGLIERLEQPATQPRTPAEEPGTVAVEDTKTFSTVENQPESTPARTANQAKQPSPPPSENKGTF